ncbi:2,3-bisphosphoglycerate-independent phosphoglycerate mutase [Actinomycetota bacterium]
MTLKNNKISKPICLIILDGWGQSRKMNGNAITLAKTPNMDNYKSIFPNTSLEASGESVGLPDGQMGNSEVGHLNIGAGRVVYQELTRISKEINNGEFFNNTVLNAAMDNAKSNDRSLHLMGLVSDGGVHSHITHLKALIDLAIKKKVKNIYIHAFLDGRDVPPRSAVPYLEDLDKFLNDRAAGEIATVSGRYYSMDRDNRWARTRKAYDTLVYREGEKFDSAARLVEKSYEGDINDEFIVPSLVKIKDEKKGRIKTDDSVIFFNFRPDRARQLTRAFIEPDFSRFDRDGEPPEVFFVSMTQYDKKFNCKVAFLPQVISNTLGEILSANGLRQLRIAETEKYAHVTFFFNGGIEKPYPGEDRVLIPSPDVATYNLKPEMSAFEVTDKVISLIKNKKYDLIVLNYANPDMVGHTGFIESAIKAVETVDSCVGKVVSEISEVGGITVIAADHGNAEEMICPVSSGTVTAHSISPVPFIVCDRGLKINKNEGSYKLSDIAPTILKLLGLEIPAEMTGTPIV